MFTRIRARLADRSADRRSRDLLLSFLERPTDWEHIVDRTGGYMRRYHTLRSPEFVVALQWTVVTTFDTASSTDLTIAMGGKAAEAVPAHSDRAVRKFIRKALRDLQKREARKELDQFDKALSDHVLSKAAELKKQEKRLSISPAELDAAIRFA